MERNRMDFSSKQGPTMLNASERLFSTGKSIALFVGGLHRQIRYDELENIFANYLPYIQIKLPMTGAGPYRHNKGFCFIYVLNSSVAEQLVSREFFIDGRLIQVQYSAKTTKETAEDMKRKRLYLLNLPPYSTNLELTNYFKKYVNCRSAYAITDKQGNSKRFGFVELESSKDAEKLLLIGSFWMRGHQLEVRPLKEKEGVDTAPHGEVYSSQGPPNESKTKSTANHKKISQEVVQSLIPSWLGAKYQLFSHEVSTKIPRVKGKPDLTRPISPPVHHNADGLNLRYNLVRSGKFS